MNAVGRVLAGEGAVLVINFLRFIVTALECHKPFETHLVLRVRMSGLVFVTCSCGGCDGNSH